jgi:DnaJ-class molecular chaperone
VLCCTVPQVYDLADVQRNGYDLYSALELTVYDALLGARVPVKTVRGRTHIMVPAGERLCARDSTTNAAGVHLHAGICW